MSQSEVNSMAAGFKTGGRVHRTPNKLTVSVKEAILAALDEAGGTKYLVGVARDNPQVFCALLGKLLPNEITGGNSAAIKLQAHFMEGAAVMDAKLDAMRSRLQLQKASATD
ncbi:MAG: hypothetical protein ABL951_11200 [Alphaproteobacteria bacterium]